MSSAVAIRKVLKMRPPDPLFIGGNVLGEEFAAIRSTSAGVPYIKIFNPGENMNWALTVEDADEFRRWLIVAKRFIKRHTPNTRKR